MDVDEAVEENVKTLASNIFEYLVNQLSTVNNQRNINILNKLIAIKH